LCVYKSRKETGSNCNKQHKIDTLLLTQFSNEDTVVVETRVAKASFLLASMYFDINRPIDIDLQ
jgi:hypothetical protein